MKTKLKIIRSMRILLIALAVIAVKSQLAAQKNQD